MLEERYDTCHRDQNDDAKRSRNNAVHNVLCNAHPLNAEHSGDGNDSQDHQALLPGGHEPVVVKSLNIGDKTVSRAHNSENIWEPVTYAGKKPPIVSQGSTGPIVERTFMRVDDAQLGGCDNTGKKKGDCSNCQVGERYNASSYSRKRCVTDKKDGRNINSDHVKGT